MSERFFRRANDVDELRSKTCATDERAVAGLTALADEREERKGEERRGRWTHMSGWKQSSFEFLPLTDPP